MYLVVGLGNPEDKYLKTWHNMGFMVMEAVSQKLGKPIKKNECRGKILQTVVSGNEVIFALPQTYMNLSGECVNGLIKKYNILPQNLLVVYDDLDLDKGQLRFKTQGSAGTHNGMRSIIKCINSVAFNRLRVGIGRPEYGDIANYVLSDIKKIDEPIMFDMILKGADAVLDFVSGKNVEAIMQACNTK